MLIFGEMAGCSSVFNSLDQNIEFLVLDTFSSCLSEQVHICSSSSFFTLSSSSSLLTRATLESKQSKEKKIPDHIIQALFPAGHPKSSPPPFLAFLLLFLFPRATTESPPSRDSQPPILHRARRPREGRTLLPPRPSLDAHLDHSDHLLLA